MVYHEDHERALYNYFTHNNQFDICKAYDGNVGCNTIEYPTYSDWLYFLWRGLKTGINIDFFFSSELYLNKLRRKYDIRYKCLYWHEN